MTSDEINVAIAEHCGWTAIRIEQLERDHPHDSDWPHGVKPDEVFSRSEVPDYCGDLNAMHEAEKTLKLMGLLVFNVYTLALLTLCAKQGNHTYCATARQRAEAFLRTVGKWKGDTK